MGKEIRVSFHQRVPFTENTEFSSHYQTQGAHCLIIILTMEAVSTSETSVNFHLTACHNIPEDRHLRDDYWNHNTFTLCYRLSVHEPGSNRALEAHYVAASGKYI
jgi:hypothetical protein